MPASVLGELGRGGTHIYRWVDLPSVLPMGWLKDADVCQDEGCWDLCLA